MKMKCIMHIRYCTDTACTDSCMDSIRRGNQYILRSRTSIGKLVYCTIDHPRSRGRISARGAGPGGRRPKPERSVCVSKMYITKLFIAEMGFAISLPWCRAPLRLVAAGREM